MMRWMSICVGVLAVGCGDAGLTDYMDDDVPAGVCEDTEGAACETGGEGDACASSQQCGGDLVCAATFDGDIGAFECRSACIPTMDETQWCMDDASCCDAEARCGSRGYCMIEEEQDSGGESSESGTGTGAGTGSSGVTSA